MTASPTVPSTEQSSDDPLLSAYRILLRVAREKKAAARRAVAESPPDGQEKGASRSKLTPVHHLDLHLPDQRFAQCPSSE
jgi:hypothetical protein